jgi:uncharacterized protein YjbI with pentapeptide repeats
MWKNNPELVLERIREQIKDGDLSFECYHFPDVDFHEIVEETRFRQAVDFTGAQFHGTTRFSHFQFGNASFRDAKFIGEVHFDQAEFSGNLDFSYAQFFDYADFNCSKFHGNATFNYAKFTGKYATDFASTQFFQEASFIETKLSKFAVFGSSKFFGQAVFDQTEFPGLIDFTYAEFHDDADFYFTKFSGDTFGNIRFSYANFLGSVGFVNAEFTQDSDFSHARFFEDLDFSNARFGGNADFKEVEFSGYVTFCHVKFLGDAEFTEAKFSQVCLTEFTNTIFSGNVFFSNIRMNEPLLDFSFSEFRKELFVDEIQWSRKGYQLKIEKEDMGKAITNYHLLRKSLLLTGHYRVAGELFYNEMACRRRLLSFESLRKATPCVEIRFHTFCYLKRLSKITLLKDIANISFVKKTLDNRIVTDALHKASCQETHGRTSFSANLMKEFGDWLWMQIFYYTCGFGERVSRVVGTSLTTIFLFALAYYLLLPTSITNATYLSLDCFVALAAFQSEPIPNAFRWLTYLEAGLGVFMISLFLVVFTRKMARD